MGRRSIMAQFSCVFCGEGFEQRSRYERHMAASHPPSAMSAADITRALTGFGFPAHRRELVEYASGRLPAESEVLRALKALPDRIYRDAAEVGIAFGETKAPGAPRPAGEVAAEEPPSRRGGRAAATEAASAAAVAKVLGGIDFPRSRAEILAHAKQNQARVAAPGAVLRLLERLPERSYANMAEVEIEVGRLSRADEAAPRR
jgi:hypothetical protein